MGRGERRDERAVAAKRDILKPCSHPQSPPKGFTLVELLISSLLMAMIGLVLTAAFSSGLKVYERAKSLETDLLTLLLIEEKIEKDIRNTFLFSLIPFQGNEKKISFAGLVGPGRFPGKVSYFADDKNNFFRQELLPFGVLAALATGKYTTVLLAREVTVKFRYYCLDPVTGKMIWQAATPKGAGMPQGVMFELLPQGHPTGLPMKRTVWISAGN